MKDRLILWIDRIDWTMVGFLISIYLIWQIGIIGYWDNKCWIFLFICLLGARKYQTDVEWSKFFLFSIPFLILLFYANKNGTSFWWSIASNLFKKQHHIWDWDQFMNSIPLNSGSWARIIHFNKVDSMARWMYNYGFVLPVWISVFYSFWRKSLKSMLHCAMSGHLIQLPLILPFYNLILLKEVWFVKAQPDLLLRNFATKNDMLVTVMNCFPSMHTSISFAMLLLALRQQDKWFKSIMIVYCSSIAVSTLYLQIHWVLDIFAGMALGYVSVKLIDLIINTVNKRIPASLKDFYTSKNRLSIPPKTDGSTFQITH